VQGRAEHRPKYVNAHLSRALWTVNTCSYIYIILGIPVRYPLGITGKYLKSRVGISKNTIDLCSASIDIFQNARPAFAGERLYNAVMCPPGTVTNFRAGSYKRLRDLRQVSDRTCGQFPDSPGRPQ